MRRSVLLAGTVAATLLAALIPAGAATADVSTDGCGTSITMPSTIRITSYLMEVPASLHSNCSIGGASYDVVRQDGAWAYGLWYSIPGVQNWSLWSSDGPGYYRATGGDVWDLDFNSLDAPNSNTALAKYDHSLRWGTPHRSGGYVTLREYASRFSYSGDYGSGGYVAWRGATVLFQERTYGQWHTVKTVTANSSGVASATIHASRHYWRALVLGTSTIWGGKSGIHWA
jgi:hypothetical protein